MGLKERIKEAIVVSVQKHVGKQGGRLTAEMIADQAPFPAAWTTHSLDYVRYKALQLAVREITDGNVPGSIAELGVYKGKFAQILNELFPDRDIYLFDTFEGFSADQATGDLEAGYTSGPVQQFDDTSVELVLSRLPNRERAIVRKGLFPDTFTGLEDVTFAFISLDPDLYEPVRDGLKYFWPRLSPGGFIFVHDYNNQHYQGVRRAVHEFCAQEGCGFVPIPDSCGTAIIAKPR